MKKLLLTMACAGAVTVSAFAQLLDEKNVTITMDLQPVLQLNLQGPDQLDFTFDNIASYYSGITKYGASILKVSASVSFDLWAVGLSQGQTGNLLWDNVVQYNSASVNGVDVVPINALELRQYPPNPSAAATSTCAGITVGSPNSDYSGTFPPYLHPSSNFTAAAVNNNIYTVANATPYLPPTTLAAAGTEKYIAGASGTAVDCGIRGGSYFMETLVAGAPSDGGGVTGATVGGYYFVMDYRIVPGLPVKFPASQVASAATNDLLVGQSNFDADAARTAAGLTVAGADFTAPGVYSMYVKYILVEDQ